MTQELWLSEEQSPGYRTQWKVSRILHQEQTPYQHLQIVEMEDFGRALILDGCVQTTVGDEFIYHEMISHVPLHVHPAPERILVIGGGDGGTVREVLRHGSVRRVDMVEIDERVVDVCRRFLPETSSMLSHPRVRLHIGDGREWVAQHRDEYDLILVDSSDPQGPAGGLFTRSFYQDVHRALKDRGLFVCQTLSPFFHHNLIREVYRVVADYFPITMPYLAVIPTYPSGLHCFLLGSKKHHPLTSGLRPLTFSTRWYTPDVHRAAFVLPPTVAGLLEQPAKQQVTSRA